ncbi:MAG: mechanosensitive ion channel family protein [Candidatus Omnitrophica bacterium]|nr:mechanosensitive ion channel family protein [Candidatus Omnitrophota bacterium]
MLTLVEVFMPLIIFLGTLLIGYLLRNVLLRRLSGWAQKTKTGIGDIVISAMKGPFMIWCLILAVYFSLEFSKLPEKVVDASGKILLSLGIFSITWVLAKISTQLVKRYAAKMGGALPTTSLTENMTRIVVFGIGFLIILQSLGISIAPILATLGIGGLAVALGLQDTLSNLFAGVHVTLARQIKIGDYIKLESGEEGYVIDITWRTTKIRMLPNNIVLVPNAKLAQAIVVNYYLPDTELAVLVQVGVHYNSDLKKVEQVTCEVAKEVMKEIKGGVPTFEPFIRYHTFGDSSINFTVILRAKEFVDQYLIKHEFVKRLHERYAKEGIVIPYPIRAINYEQEKKE